MKESFRKVTGQAEASDTGGAAAATGATAGTGPATGRQESFGFSLPVAQTQYGPKHLTQVHTWTPCEQVREVPSQFYCLDMEENAVDETVRWVRDVRQIRPFERRRLPVVYVIGPGRPLSSRELHAVNEELTSVGAYFFERPDFNASFRATMRMLRDELARQYGSSETNNAVVVQERDPDSLITR